MNREEAAKMIDHTILRANAQKEEIIKLCEEALNYGFASVCINPCHVPLAYEILSGSSIKVCTVIGFPLGANTKEVKAFEAEQAVKQGASEVDMVINIGALKDGDTQLVKEDITAVVNAAKEVNPNTIVKVIIETCLLTEDEKKTVIQLCLEAKADFVKTSTGFSTGGAVKEDIELMRKLAGSDMSVKASGGVKNYADFLVMAEAGADRIGTSAGIAIIEGAEGAE